MLQSEFLFNRIPMHHKTMIFFLFKGIFILESSCLMHLGSSYKKAILVVVVTPTGRFIASCYVMPS